MLAAIRESCRLFHSDQVYPLLLLRRAPLSPLLTFVHWSQGIVELIAKRYDLKVEDAQQYAPEH